jgi:hypothetical protein
MTDQDALRALSVGYAAAVDALDGQGFAALFTADGELWVPDGSAGAEPTICRSGGEALARIPSGLARYHVTHHRVGPAVLTVDGDLATGEVAGVAHHVTATGPADGATGCPGTDTVWFLVYRDRYRREVGGWRFARRALHLRWVEERPVDHVGPPRGTGGRTHRVGGGVRSGP